MSSYTELHVFHWSKKQIIELYVYLRKSHHFDVVYWNSDTCRHLSKMLRNSILGHPRKTFQSIAFESKIKLSQGRSVKLKKI